MPASDLIDITAELLHETGSAFYIFDGDVKRWLPKSLVEHNIDEGTFTMPEWLAQEKELI